MGIAKTKRCVLEGTKLEVPRNLNPVWSVIIHTHTEGGSRDLGGGGGAYGASGEGSGGGMPPGKGNWGWGVLSRISRTAGTARVKDQGGKNIRVLGEKDLGIGELGNGRTKEWED